MKKLQLFFIILFFCMLSVPLVLFNTESNVVSPIDNRALTEFPIGEGRDESMPFFTQLNSYIDDRIGLRNEMIELFTLANDNLFGEMIHPLYMYGEEGYVFRQTDSNVEYGSFHREFADAVIRMNEYCRERNVPFVFVLDPEKEAVYTEYLPDDISYDGSWVDEMTAYLTENGVICVDTTDVLTEKKNQGEVVFNKQYNAGHWNDLGAFYGANEVLTALGELMPNVRANLLSEYNITDKLNTTLQVSKFPIHEYEPEFALIDRQVTNLTDIYNTELELHPQYRYFYYIQNDKRASDGAPSALVFQGSYYIGMGYKFFENAFSEYAAVHDYQNVIDLDYYFNVFTPDCVIFEVAQYTFLETYFSIGRMSAKRYSPTLAAFGSYSETVRPSEELSLRTDIGSCLADISVSVSSDIDHVYLVTADAEYDFYSIKDGVAALTVKTENLPGTDYRIVCVDKDSQTKLVYEFDTKSTHS